MKNVYKQKRQQGFTIIEVLIVLAIAALILLIVFLAVPSLQRNARNTQRKNDTANLATAANNFAGNNNGVQPTALGTISGETTSIAVKCAGSTITSPAITQTSATALTTCPSSNLNYDSAKLGYYDPSKVFIANNAFGALTPSAPGGESNAIISTNSIIVDVGYKCNNTNSGIDPAVSSRSIAVLYVQETSSGNGNLQCAG